MILPPSCPKQAALTNPQKGSRFNPADFDPDYQFDPNSPKVKAGAEALVNRAKRVCQSLTESGYENLNYELAKHYHKLWMETVRQVLPPIIERIQA